MKNESHHPDDDLERRLRSGLEGFAPPASEQLWAGIEGRLPKKRRRRPLAWWWAGAAVMLLSGATYLYFGQKAGTEALREPLPATQQEKRPAPDEPVTKKGLSAQKTTTPGTRTAIQKAAADIPDISLPQTAVLPLAHSTPAEIKSVLPGSISVWQTLEEVPPLPVSGLTLPARAYPAVETPLPSPRKIRRNRFYAGMIAGPFWQWESAGPHAGHAAVREHTRGGSFGWQAGLTAGFNLNAQWSIYTGLWRQSINSSVSHHATLRLKDGILIPPAKYTDPESYAFEYALFSGGDITNVRVEISEVDHQTTMPDDEPFTLSMQTTHRRTDWAIPLAVQRRFGHGRWQIDLQAGGLLGIPAGRTVTVDHFTEQCADLCYAIGYTPEFSVQDKGHISFSWLAGANLGYRITPRWSFGLNPVFFAKNNLKNLALHTTTRFNF
jgi:hypothetical protein